MAGLAVAFLLLQGFGDPTRDFLLLEKDAVLLAPAEVVCGSMCDSFKWSRDSRFVAVQRTAISDAVFAKIASSPGEKPPAEVNPSTEIWIWQASVKTSRKVLSLPVREGRIEGYDWLTGSPTVFVEVVPADRPEEVWLASLNGAARKIATAEEGGFLEVISSGASSSFAIVRGSGRAGGATSVTFLDSSGRSTAEFPLPPRIAIYEWSPDGKTLLARRFEKGGLEFVAMGMDGKFVPAEPPSLRVPEVEMQVFAMKPELTQKDAGFSLKAPTAVLAPGKGDPENPSFAVIGTDATMPALSPDFCSVAFMSQGVVLWRPLIRVPKEVYFNARDAALRTEIMNKAKQAGLAIIMFASDNDDNYPTQEGWQDKVMPYIKNRDIISGFNYTFAGGSMSAIKEPANTVIGFMTGPGGRAVTYADGHVKWEKNP